MDKGIDRIYPDTLVAKTGGYGQGPQLHRRCIDDLLFDAADNDAVYGGNEKSLAVVAEVFLAARFEKPGPFIAGENAIDDGHLLIGLNTSEFLGEVVGDHRPRTFNGEEFMLDGVFTRRQDMNTVTDPEFYLFTDTIQRIAKIDIGDDIAEFAEGFSHPSGRQRIDFIIVFIDKGPTFKKDKLGNGIGMSKDRLIKIDFRTDADEAG